MQKNLTKDQEKLRLLTAQATLRRELPHLYGWKNYAWAREFLECTNRTMFMTAGNQLSKSSTQIRKVIDWATNKKLWPELWRTPPRQFWYMYPTSALATSEFDTKWIPDFLPRGSMKSHPLYGWRDQRDSKRQIVSLHFNSGVTVYFKTYSQDVHSLQGSSVHYVAVDEEMPEEIWDEVNYRRNAVDGYFSMVFTATRGQEIWRRTMEPKPNEKPNFPDAWKKQVSIFECRVYEDGTPSHWTDEKIAQTIALCKSDSEVQKRVYGKFIMDEGRKYVSFERSNNVVPVHYIPDDWFHYAGVDIGAGGDKNHPSTISFIAVKPDFSYGCVYKHWRGDQDITTAGDVVNKYTELRDHTPMAGAYYDYHAKDFHTIATRMGISFEAAEKNHEIGEQVLNTLFRNKMLAIFDTIENEPIIREFMSLQMGEDKRKSKDDSIDSVRYGVTKIPWDWSKVGFQVPIKASPIPQSALKTTQVDRDRFRDRERMISSSNDLGHEQSVEDELNEWGAPMKTNTTKISDKNALTAKDICEILKSCSENGVSEFSYLGLKVLFGELLQKNAVSEPVPETAIIESSVQAKETNFRDAYKAEKEDLDKLLLEDPLAYEEALIRGGLD